MKPLRPRLGWLVLLAIVFLLSRSGRFGTEPAADPGSQAALRIHCLDVGQADCLFVQFPGGATALVDGGTKTDGESIVAYLQEQKVERIDYLIATHPHADHIGGLPEVLEAFPVGKVYAPRAVANTATYENFLLAVKEAGLNITPASAGVEFMPGEGVRALFLAPDADAEVSLNNASAVLHLTYGDKAILLAGDAEQISEQAMLRRYPNDLAAAVLKVGHHGSADATSAAFLRAVSPDYALIPVGADNPYGYPAAAALKRLADPGVRVYRTDRDGTIVVESDGKTIRVRTEKENS